MNMTGGLHCSCGIPASDERFTRTKEKHDIVGFDKYQFTVEVEKVHCANCGYESVSAELDNPYDPKQIDKGGD